MNAGRRLARRHIRWIFWDGLPPAVVRNTVNCSSAASRLGVQYLRQIGKRMQALPFGLGSLPSTGFVNRISRSVSNGVTVQVVNVAGNIRINGIGAGQ